VLAQNAASTDRHERRIVKATAAIVNQRTVTGGLGPKGQAI